jgi:dimethylaniline monooxygenase (N-oxide forming)
VNATAITTFDSCIIGAGWSGLLACKYFKEGGLNPVVLERNATIGGVWQHDLDGNAGGVIKSTFTTSSKTTTEQSDYPMPAHFPEFPRHEQIMEYLEGYCETFGLIEHLRLGDGVVRARKLDEGWQIETQSGLVYQCARLVVCAGVHQEATDSGRGQFSDFPGPVIHSTALERRAAELRDKRVLIVGSGETASDMAGEISRLTPHLSLTSPNGQWIVNRVSNLAADRPILLDQHSSPLRELCDPTDAAFYGARVVEMFYGRCGSGVPEWQTERLFQAQFFNKNNLIVELWRAGQLLAKPGITEVDGATVRFKDNSEATYDAIVLCTGFDTVFPFLPAPYDTRRINQHFKLLLADDPSLSFVGFARPVVGSIPTIAEMQVRCLAAMYSGAIPVPAGRDATIARDAAVSQARYQSKRLSGLIDMSSYLRELAIWCEVQPDYLALAKKHPRKFWTLVSAPYNAARYRLDEPDRFDDIVRHLEDMKHPYLNNLSYWADMLIASAFPLNAHRVYHTKRMMGARALIGRLLTPIHFPSMMLSGEPSLAGNVVGAALIGLMSPILAMRAVAASRQSAVIRRDFAPEA